MLVLVNHKTTNPIEIAKYASKQFNFPFIPLHKYYTQDQAQRIFMLAWPTKEWDYKNLKLSAQDSKDFHAIMLYDKSLLFHPRGFINILKKKIKLAGKVSTQRRPLKLRRISSEDLPDEQSPLQAQPS